MLEIHFDTDTQFAVDRRVAHRLAESELGRAQIACSLLVEKVKRPVPAWGQLLAKE